MAIHETKKQTDLEKRLKLLRQQIYGKERVSIAEAVPVSEAITHNTDTSYLYQDLAKIGILATFALGAQIILFYLLKSDLLKLNFL